MDGRRRMVLVVAVTAAVGLGYLEDPAEAQPTADQLLAEVGLSPDDKQRVLKGEFVTVDIEAVSERDLSTRIVFLVKTSPDALSKQIVAGDLVTADSQVRAHGSFSATGNLTDLKGLRITSDEAKALSGAQAGSALNLSAPEVTAFKSLPSGNPQAVEQQLQRMLLSRYQAYRASGLAGVAPYDRGGGATTDLATDLRKASEAARFLHKYLPAFHAVLQGYPKAPLPGMREHLFWVKYDIQGKPTYVLTHVLAASEGVARVVAQRQYYVSTGYNGEQAVAGFLPVQGGTVVFYAGHAFTDQVAGFGGSMKRGIGRRVMAEQLKKMFDAGRKQAER